MRDMRTYLTSHLGEQNLVGMEYRNWEQNGSFPLLSGPSGSAGPSRETGPHPVGAIGQFFGAATGDNNMSAEGGPPSDLISQSLAVGVGGIPDEMMVPGISEVQSKMGSE